MKQLETYIAERLKINQFYELGLDIFDNVNIEADFIKKVNDLLDTLLTKFKNLYNGTKTSVDPDSSDKYIMIVKDKSVLVFVGDNSKDKCFLVLYNAEQERIMTINLEGRITKFIPTGHNQSNVYLLKADNALDDLLNYCEKYTNN